MVESKMDRILLHLSEMLLDRGDDISELVEHADAVDRERYNTEVIELGTDRTTVFFAMKKDLLKEVLKLLGERVSKGQDLGNFILVTLDPYPSATNNQILQLEKDLAAQGGMLQVFFARELSYNPTKHELTPRHERLGEQEAKEVMERYMIKSRAKMPIISKMDIMARWLGLRQGDIVRITRYNETSGEYYYYRCCM